MTHELGHDFDLNRAPMPNIDGVHPADHLRLIESRLKGLEILEQAFVGQGTNISKRFNTLDIQQFMIDPLIPNMYGRDELDDDDDFHVFDSEVQSLIDTLESIDNLPTATRNSWNKITDMHALFTPQKNVPLYIHWIATRGNADPDETFEQFSHISVTTLKYLQSLAHTHKDSTTPTSNQERSDRMNLLNIKSAAMLIVYIYLDRLAHAGAISPMTQPELFGTFKNLQLAYIHEKLLHTMVGPYGEYTPKDAYDTLRVAVDEQVEHSLRNGTNQRQVLSTMLSTPWSAKVGAVAAAFIENLKDTQRSMAKVMGGKTSSGDVLTLYPNLFNQIDGLFPKAAPEKPPAITPGG